jgi:two-component system, NtrC family, response regulator AtoC
VLEILLVDDETAIRMPVGDALRARGHRVAIASDGEEAMARLDAEVYHLVVSDVRLPKRDGFEILRRVRRECPSTDVLLMTAYGTIADAVVAMKEQAVDYVTKPFDVQELVGVVDRIDERRRLRDELRQARAQLAARRADDLIIGRSPAIVRLREQVDAIADSDAAVLLTGESGTGKELVARMLHDRSPRRDKRFVAVNCAAVPPTLIEAELFGYERGAFTGALRKREGRFAAADGGTLFLDEIGEMPLDAQAKLLRVLQDGTFEPIGTNTTVRVDVRLISATNRDLRAAIERGGFRQDLYFRIRVLELLLPALRERPTDLPLLVEHFLRELTPAVSTTPVLSPAAWAALGRYEFPGNVRELKHALQHATILARGGEIQLQHLPRDLQGDAADERAGHVRPLSLVLEEYEREHILRTLKLVGGERQTAAKLLGISRKSLWKKLGKYGLSDFGGRR